MPIVRPSGTSSTGVDSTSSVANANHTHTISDVSGLLSGLGTKAERVHLHKITEVAGLQTILNNIQPSAHTHTTNDIVGLASSLNSLNASISTLNDSVTSLVTLSNTHSTQINTLNTQVATIINNSNNAPVNTVLPSISGTTKVGSILTVSNGSWSNTPTSYTYQWYRTIGTTKTTISGATSASYTLTSTDAGYMISASVTALNSSGNSTATSAVTVAIDMGPTASVAPSISGTAAVGQTLTLSKGTWSGTPTYTYQWLREGVAISGATALTYVTTAADAGKKISARVVATISTGSTTADSNQLTIVAAPELVSAPTLSPSAILIGTVVSVSSGSWNYSPSFTYQWKLNGVNITGATGSTYTTVTADATKTLACTVTATNMAGTLSSTTAGINVQNVNSSGTEYANMARATVGLNANLNDCLPFPADNAWNVRVDNAPVSPYSSGIINYSGLNLVGLHPDFGSYTEDTTDDPSVMYGIPYYIVDNTTPMVTIQFTTEVGYAFGDESDPGPYPIPPGAMIEGGVNGEDRHVIVINKTTNMLYEMYRTTKISNSVWMCGSSAKFDVTSNDWRPWAGGEWTSADAAGLPIFPGLVRYEEAARGPGGIKHAIRFTLANTRAGYVAPASHWASTKTAAEFAPLGARFRLKSSFVINPAFSTETKAMLTAMKEYGMILADNGSNGFFSGAPDSRWDNGVINPELATVKLGDFEVLEWQAIKTENGWEYNTAPVNVIMPSITGVVAYNNTVSCYRGTWTNSPASYTYQWKLDGINITGATLSSYKPVTSDIGKTLTCAVVAINAYGSSITKTTAGSVVLSSAPPEAVVNLPPPMPSPPSVAQSTSNPVTTALTGTRTFNVGPGQTYADPDTVPWDTLTAGDVVNIYYRATPYNSLIAIDGSGTATNKIIINGVTDANGNRPKFDVTTSSKVASGTANIWGTQDPIYGYQRLGVITVINRQSAAYNAYWPSHITIKNIEIRGAYTGDTRPLTLLSGTNSVWFTGAGIHLQSSKDVTIDNCVIYDCSFGVFVMAKSDMLFYANLRTTIRNCRIYGNGTVGSYKDHNVYMQSANPVVEGNYFGAVRAGSNGSTYKSRSSGEVFRYNWVESSDRAIDFVHSEEQTTGILIQTDYPYTHCYGNVIVNDSAVSTHTWSPVHFGGDNGGEDGFDGSGSHFDSLVNPGVAYNQTLRYRERLFFYNNTYVSRGTGANTQSQFFDLSLAGGNLYYDGKVAPRTQVDAWNNVFYCENNTQSWVQWAGRCNLKGTNYAFGTIIDQTPAGGSYPIIREDWVTVVKDNVIAGTPGFTSLSTLDYRPTSASAFIDLGTTPADISTGFQYYQVEFQPRIKTNGMVPRTVQGNLDLGAFELVDSTKPNCTVLPSITATGTAIGSTISVLSTGMWTNAPVLSTQWLRNGVVISGVTGSSYTTTAADEGKNISIKVTATANGSSTYALSNMQYAGTVYSATPSSGTTPPPPPGPTPPAPPAGATPVSLFAPEILGANYVGQTVVASRGIYSNSPTSFTFVWKRNGTIISGATSDSYTLVSADSGTTLTVDVTATNSTGSVTVSSSGLSVIATSSGNYDPAPDGTINFALANGTYLSSHSEFASLGGYGLSSYIIENGAVRVVDGKGTYGNYVGVTRAGANYKEYDAVMKPGKTGGFTMWFGTNTTSTTAVLTAVLGSDNKVTVYVDGNWVGAFTTAASLITATAYTHMKLKINGTNYYVMVNGILVSTGTIANTASILSAGLTIDGTPETSNMIELLRIKN